MIHLWLEGYSATGDSAPASFEGLYNTDSMDEAVQGWAEAYSRRWPTTNMTDLLRKNDDGVWSFWGMRFYDNEQSARKSFG